MKGELLVYLSFFPGVSAPCHYKYHLRFDVQSFLCPVYYIFIYIYIYVYYLYIYFAGPLSCILGCNNELGACEHSCGLPEGKIYVQLITIRFYTRRCMKKL